MKKLTIRKARIEDLDGIIKLFKSWKSSEDEEYARIYYDDFFNQAQPNDEVFVGEMNNEIVSVIGLCPDKLETKDVYWLGWFYTHEKYKENKIGSRLLAYIIDSLPKKARKLYVDTSSDEFYKPALNFYLNKGFQKEAVLKDYYKNGEDQIILGMDI